MLLRTLNVPLADRKALNNLAQSTGIHVQRLRALDAHGLEPSGAEMTALARFSGLSETAFRLRIGFLNRALRKALSEAAEQVAAVLTEMEEPRTPTGTHPAPEPTFRTSLGTLYQGDCIELMRSLPDQCCDLVFADPPFNLDKLYPSEMDDDLRQEHYLEWCENWLDECTRLLRPGGSLLIYNLPRWNTFLGAYLNRHLTFRHWVAVDIKFSLPIAGRLYPSHYSLLYYIKGERPATFQPDRLPMEICPSCSADLKDYGGYKDKMNPSGVNLTDVWYDIPPVRHAKYKKRKSANELSIKLLDRIIEMASKEGDTVLDPFGGSGTTYAVAEMKGRKWIGMELGPVDGIIERLQDLDDERKYLQKIRSGYNRLFLPDQERRRELKGLWTSNSFGRQAAEAEKPQQLSLE